MSASPVSLLTSAVEMVFFTGGVKSAFLQLLLLPVSHIDWVTVKVLFHLTSMTSTFKGFCSYITEALQTHKCSSG